MSKSFKVAPTHSWQHVSSTELPIFGLGEKKNKNIKIFF